MNAFLKNSLNVLSIVVCTHFISACGVDKKDNASAAAKGAAAPKNETQTQTQKAQKTKEEQVAEDLARYDYFVELRSLTLNTGIPDGRGFLDALMTGIPVPTSKGPGVANIVPVIHHFGNSNSDQDKNLENAFSFSAQQYWRVHRGTQIRSKKEDRNQIEIPSEVISNRGIVMINFSVFRDNATANHGGSLTSRKSDFETIYHDDFTLNLMDETLYQVSDVLGQVDVRNAFTHTIENQYIKAEFMIFRRVE